MCDVRVWFYFCVGFVDGDVDCVCALESFIEPLRFVYVIYVIDLCGSFCLMVCVCWICGCDLVMWGRVCCFLICLECTSWMVSDDVLLGLVSFVWWIVIGG